jgi:hypothetical protein
VASDERPRSRRDRLRQDETCRLGRSPAAAVGSLVFDCLPRKQLTKRYRWNAYQGGPIEAIAAQPGVPKVRHPIGGLVAADKQAQLAGSEAPKLSDAVGECGRRIVYQSRPRYLRKGPVSRAFSLVELRTDVLVVSLVVDAGPGPSITHAAHSRRGHSTDPRAAVGSGLLCRTREAAANARRAPRRRRGRNHKTSVAADNAQRGSLHRSVARYRQGWSDPTYAIRGMCLGSHLRQRSDPRSHAGRYSRSAEPPLEGYEMLATNRPGEGVGQSGGA